jgi:hypothetical protein
MTTLPARPRPSTPAWVASRCVTSTPDPSFRGVEGHRTAADRGTQDENRGRTG